LATTKLSKQQLPDGLSSGGSDVTSVNEKTGDVVLTKEDIGLGNVNNTSDVNKPISTLQQSEFNKKVDKVAGMGLSTEDYTNAEKVKLNGIEPGAQKNTVSQGDLDNKVDKVAGKGLSTEDYSTNEKAKLNGIEVGAQKNTVSTTDLATKVDKVAGKGLSTEDYTTTEKNKLFGIEVGAQVNPSAVGTTGNAGLMTSADKAKLDGVATGADVSKTLVAGTNITLTPSGNNITIAASGSSGEMNQNAFSNVLVGATTVAANAKTDTLTMVAGTNVTLTPDAATKKVTIAATDTTYSAVGITGNAGLMTAADKSKLDGIATGAQANTVTSVNTKTGAVTINASDVGLGSVNNTADSAKPVSTAQQTALDLKVDKVTGKQLSTEDYTTTEKTKLAGIIAGAQPNQNAFTTIKVGTTNVDADAVSDTLTLIAGTNITLTPNATTDEITIASTDLNTTYTDVGTTGNSGLMSVADKVKLNGIATGADVSKTLVAGTNITLTPSGNNITIASTDTNTTYSDVGTTGNSGLMSVADKVKLNGIATGAQVNPGDVGTTGSSGLMTVADKVKLNGIADSATKNTITLNGTANANPTFYAPTVAGTSAQVFTSNGGNAPAWQNPAVSSVAGKTGAVTLVKGDVGLGNVDNTADSAKPISTATQTALNGKVDVVAGKGLSTNDFTATLKTKLDGIEDGAQKNKTLVEGTGISLSTSGNNITITNSATTVEYNLTSQMDGVKQVFNIDASITASTQVAVYYAGQRLIKGTNYTLDFVGHKMTTLFANPPTSDSSRTLVLITGGNTASIVAPVSEAPQDGKVYARKNAGWSDINSLLGAPAQTITCSMANLQTTIDALPKRLSGNVTINVTSGDISSSPGIIINNFEGPYILSIVCVNSSNQQITVKNTQTHKCSNISIAENTCCEVKIQAFTAVGAGMGFVGLRNSCKVSLAFCNVTSGSSSTSGNEGFMCDESSGLIVLYGCTFSNQFSAIHAVSSRIFVNMTEGTGNGIVYDASNGGVINTALSTITGNTLISFSNSGVVMGPGYNGADLTEQLTGRVFNGKPTYNRLFTGTITAAVNTAVNTTLATLPSGAKIADAGGSWEYTDAGAGSVMLAGQGWGTTTYGSGFDIVDNNGSLRFTSLSAVVRTSRPYQVWVEYTK